MVKSLRTRNIHLKNEKQVILGVSSSGKGKLNGDGKGKGRRLMYFIYVCENRTMELEILSRLEGVRENDGGDETNQGTL
jgi:hypothetical protein